MAYLFAVLDERSWAAGEKPPALLPSPLVAGTLNVLAVLRPSPAGFSSASGSVPLSATAGLYAVDPVGLRIGLWRAPLPPCPWRA